MTSYEPYAMITLYKEHANSWHGFKQYSWRHCLVENLLGGRSSLERLMRSIVVVVVPEPSQPVPRAGWTPSPERVKAVDPHYKRLEPLLDEVPIAVFDPTVQIVLREGGQVAHAVDQ